MDECVATLVLVADRVATALRVLDGVWLCDAVTLRVASAVGVPLRVAAAVRENEGRRDPVCVWLPVRVGVTEDGGGATRRRGENSKGLLACTSTKERPVALLTATAIAAMPVARGLELPLFCAAT